MTTQERIDEIRENLLWMGNKPGVAVVAAYIDPYTGKRVHFGKRYEEELEEDIRRYAEQHPVD